MLKYHKEEEVILAADYDDNYDHIHIPKGTKGTITDMNLLLASYDVEFTGFGTVFLPEEILASAANTHFSNTKNH